MTTINRSQLSIRIGKEKTRYFKDAHAFNTALLHWMILQYKKRIDESEAAT